MGRALPQRRDDPLRGLSYLCGGHLDAELARHEAGDVELAVGFCKRYLWAVRQWDFHRLEHALGGALSEYQRDLAGLEAAERAARERAVNPDA